MKDHESERNSDSGGDVVGDRDSVSDSWGRAAAYDAYADGLHTYALGGLRNHEAAAAAVYSTFIAADHHVAHLGDAEVLRPWLYAITRFYCRIGELPRLRLTPPGRKTRDASDPDGAMAGLERTLLAAELASLDWHDTDGLVAAHREVLELSVRHGLESKAVGLMLCRPSAESFELLSSAWHELERSLAAMALLRTTREHCAELADLAQGWSGRMTVQRREPLVAHVDSCSRCQYYLHKVVGTPQAPTILPHVAAPKLLRDKVLGDLADTSPETEARRAGIAGRLVRFDRHGFPMPMLPAPPIAPEPLPQRSKSGARVAADGLTAGSASGAGRLAGSGASRKGSSGRKSAFASLIAAATGSASGGDGRKGSAGTAPVGSATAAGAVMADTSRAAGASGTSASGTVMAGASAAGVPGASGVAMAGASHPGSTLPGMSGTRSSQPRPLPRSAAAAKSASSKSASAKSAPARSGAAARNRPRRSPVRSALTSSAVLGGVVAAGGTALVLFAPSASSNKALLTQDPGRPESISQLPDAPIPTSSSPGSLGIPITGSSAKSAPIADRAVGTGSGAVILQAVVVPTDPGANPLVPPSAGPFRPQPPTMGSSLPGAFGPPTLPSFTPLPPPSSSGTPTTPAQGTLNVRVDQRANNPGQVTVTLWNSGNAPVAWTATPDAPYLTLSQASGTIAPGTQQAVTVTVDQATAPTTPWTAHVRFDPAGSSVTLSGGSTATTPPPTTPPPTPPSSTGTTPPSTTPPPTTPSSTATSPSKPPTTAPSTTPPATTPPPPPTTSSTTAPPPTTPPTTAPSTKPPTPVQTTFPPRTTGGPATHPHR